MRTSWILLAAALFGASGVALAAYASHGLGFITDPTLRTATRLSLQQAVQQQLLHAPVLLALGIWAQLDAPASPSRRWRQLSAALFTLGLLLFCGLIYLRTFTGIASLRALVPWGGTCLILGWLALGVAAVRCGRAAQATPSSATPYKGAD